MYLYAIKNQYCASITHKYLIVGHTQNEGDSMHAQIEKNKNLILKNPEGGIFIPHQWITTIQTAKKTGHPYTVVEMTTNDIFDFKTYSNDVAKNWTHNTNSEKVVWNDIHIFKVSAEGLYYKYRYNDDDFKEINFIGKTMRRKKSLGCSNLIKAYEEPPGIPKDKMKHLMDMCKSNAIPPKYHEYYNNLKVYDE